MYVCIIRKKWFCWEI